eukprot:CAMPEP_0113429262 /NCGR_PEP_ID=MMETSP0013_2-20120614/32349_1 /TAXON_ID=2843 ORGANISM="Skeletonema costatum, Strain 1716" /NCGR_SAMPLE_ID=MMETSP0013_2 /ASSEMBLY_ACC=CAM_ASM_000158 /LENGTH=303 /DNA_ID=CAMNT_0000317959 /DNA_START=31 /DNA_END=942 /DNA_ORIENTATION=- /assembly_acc=CAM_ASM_000158
MSSNLAEDENVMMCCAACGVAEVDDTKLKKCNGCYLVKYCGVKCQRNHRPQHKRECKKRAAELRDEILFKQNESSDLGDCPICCLPLSNDDDKSILMGCCSKRICIGCDFSNQLRETKEKLQKKCLFCRHPSPNSEEEAKLNNMKRVEANDPVAIYEMGKNRYFEGDYKSAFKYFSKAAGLGDAEAHYLLSVMYRKGDNVEKDEKKEVYHLEEAAIGGHPYARHNLGCREWENGRMDRAIKHYIIAAKLGHDRSLEVVKKNYTNGYVSKEDFAAALRAHQAAVDATKSPQREAAEESNFYGEN